MTILSLAGLLVAGMFQGAFTLEDDGASVTVREGDTPVFVYLYLPGRKPVLVSERYRRGCYIHPLYGLDGEELTQDFPLDHFHHRGVFWAWPDSTLGERKMDVWAFDGARQVYSKWLKQETDNEKAVLSVENHWVFDDAPEVPVIRETVTILVHPAADNHRDLDFELTFSNVSQDVFTLRGSGTETKGYGGFCLRPDATRRPLVFTSKQGVSEEDALELESPWVDVSYATTPGGESLSGAAIFQHPDNPGYPHPGWILRHYGFLGQSWPHTVAHVMAPGDSVTLRYRLHVHRGAAAEAGVESAFHLYEQSAQN